MQTRDLMYASDVAHATVLAMRCPRANGRALNVATGRPPATILSIARFVCDYLCPGMEPLLTGEFRPHDVRHICLDGAEMAKLGFVPRVGMEEGLRMHCEWILDEHRKRDLEVVTLALTQWRQATGFLSLRTSVGRRRL